MGRWAAGNKNDYTPMAVLILTTAVAVAVEITK